MPPMRQAGRPNSSKNRRSSSAASTNRGGVIAGVQAFEDGSDQPKACSGVAGPDGSHWPHEIEGDAGGGLVGEPL